MIRVLHIINGINNGGAETFILNYYSALDQSKIQFDFLLRTNNNNKNNIEKLKKLGAKIFIVPSFPKHLLANYLETKRILEQGNYDAIHIHANSFIYIVPFLCIRSCNLEKVILHSHNTKSISFLGNVIHHFNRKVFSKKITDCIACGEEAGAWMFGKKNYLLLNNAIDTKKYSYKESIRTELRKKLNIKEKFVVGHVGRFSKQKNHEFVLKVFSELLKSESTAVLLLVGTGEFETNVKEQAKLLGIEDKVIFLGQRNDVYKLYSIMDVLLFPSLYEGLPFTLIEAQAESLPIVTSTEVSHKVKITEFVTFLNLSEDMEIWVNELLKAKGVHRSSQITGEISASGYDIWNNIEKLEKVYLEKR